MDAGLPPIHSDAPVEGKTGRLNVPDLARSVDVGSSPRLGSSSVDGERIGVRSIVGGGALANGGSECVSPSLSLSVSFVPSSVVPSSNVSPSLPVLSSLPPHALASCSFVPSPLPHMSPLPSLSASCVTTANTRT